MRRWSFRWVVRGLFAAGALAVFSVPFLAACSSEAPETATGRVGLLLTAEKNGFHYRLRNAVFAVEGPESHTLITEDDPDAEVIEVELGPGEYALTLQEGWYLERQSGADYEQVGAELLSENPISFFIQSSVVTTATFRFLTDGVVVGMEPPANWADVLGFEDDSLWTSSAQLSLSNTRVEAQHSLAVVGSSFHNISSVPLSEIPFAGDSLVVSLRLPSQQPNPNWYGDVQLRLDAPSVGLDEHLLGTVSLTGLPTGQFVDLTYDLDQTVRAALAESYDDLVIRVGLNLPYNATGTYRFDNMRFGGVSSCDFTCSSGMCVDGICQIECPALYGNCDGDWANACETPLDSDSSNCGGCGLQCSAGSVCTAGECVSSPDCGPTEADCDGNPTNACEVDTSTDENHCGACGNACDAGQECVDGLCLAGDLNAAIQVTSDWGSGYCANVLLTNVGGASTTTWQLVLNPRGATLSPWNANSTLSGGAVTLTPLSWNAQIAPTETSTSVGFCASRSSGSAVATITSLSP